MTTITHNSNDQDFEANLTRLLELQKERQSLLNMNKVLRFSETSNHLKIAFESFKMSMFCSNVIETNCEAEILLNKEELINWNNLLSGFINTRLVVLETEIKTLMI